MSSSPTSNEPKPSSDLPSEQTIVVAYTMDGRPIRVRSVNPWQLPYGSWAEGAKVG